MGEELGSCRGVAGLPPPRPRALLGVTILTDRSKKINLHDCVCNSRKNLLMLSLFDVEVQHVI